MSLSDELWRAEDPQPQLISSEYPTTTLNEAPAHASTHNRLLDFHYFSTRGADVVKYIDSILEQRDITLKNGQVISGTQALLRYLIYLRHFRGNFGKGEKKLYFDTLNHIFNYFPNSTVRKWFLNKNWVENIGCWKDYYQLAGCKRFTVQHFKEQLQRDLNALKFDLPISLCAKWAPSENSLKGKSIFKNLALSLFPNAENPYAEYRKMISLLRSKLNIVERNMCAKKFSEIDYQKVSGKAMQRYGKAFNTQDGQRYQQYLTNVREGHAKINVEGLELHTLISKIREGQLNPDDLQLIDTTFQQMIQKAERINVKIACVADTSGSMMDGASSAVPLDVSVGIALYSSCLNGVWLPVNPYYLDMLPSDIDKDKVTKVYVGHWLSFSASPEWQPVVSRYTLDDGLTKWVPLSHMYQTLKTDQWQMNTDFEAVYRKLLLDPQEYDAVITISDMQFDQCMTSKNLSNYDSLKADYLKKGKEIPKMIFWNVASYSNVPVTSNELNCILVSGFSTNILKDALSGSVDPTDFLLETLEMVGQKFDFSDFPLVY